MIDKTEGAIKNGQSRDTSNIWQKTQNEDKQHKNQKDDNTNQIKATLLRILIEFSLLDPKIHLSYCPHFLVRRRRTIRIVIFFWKSITSSGINFSIKV